MAGKGAKRNAASKKTLEEQLAAAESELQMLKKLQKAHPDEQEFAFEDTSKKNGKHMNLKSVR